MIIYCLLNKWKTYIEIYILNFLHFRYIITPLTSDLTAMKIAKLQKWGNIFYLEWDMPFLHLGNNRGKVIDLDNYLFTASTK